MLIMGGASRTLMLIVSIEANKDNSKLIHFWQSTEISRKFQHN